MNNKRICFFLLTLFFVSKLFAADDSIYGIDISHHQGEISWEQVKQWNGKKLHFVYIKATEGATLIDKNYKKNLQGAKDQNLLVGSYHYFKTGSSPEAQFENFKKMASKDSQNLIPIVDVEERGKCNIEAFHARLRCFLKLVEKYYGCKPMIYTANNFYNKHLANKYKEYKVFIGRYSKNMPTMKDKQDWCVWQFSKKGVVHGIPKAVDINMLHEKFEIAKLMINQASAETASSAF